MLHITLPPETPAVSDDELIRDLVLHSAAVRAVFLAQCDYAVGVRGRRIVTVRKVVEAQGNAPVERRVVSLDPNLRRTSGVLVRLGDAEPDLVATLVGHPDPLTAGPVGGVRMVELALIVKGVSTPLGQSGRPQRP